MHFINSLPLIINYVSIYPSTYFVYIFPSWFLSSYLYTYINPSLYDNHVSIYFAAGGNAIAHVNDIASKTFLIPISSAYLTAAVKCIYIHMYFRDKHMKYLSILSINKHILNHQIIKGAFIPLL